MTLSTADGLITLVFSTQADPESWAIRRGTDSKYSHVDARMPEGGLLGARFGADGGPGPGVQIRPEGYAPFSRTLTLTIPSILADDFYAALREQIGKPYDWRAIVAFVGDQDRDFRDDDSFFCDELQLAMGVISQCDPAQQSAILGGKDRGTSRWRKTRARPIGRIGCDSVASPGSISASLRFRRA